MATDDQLTQPKTHKTFRAPSVGAGVIGFLGIVALFVGFVAWAVSSPVGASPDDDYHLGSIWCPWPAQSSGCVFTIDGDEVTTVTVPQSVASSAACYAFHPELSGACTETFSDDTMVETDRFDKGVYPQGFYRFSRLFVGNEVFRTIVNLRIMNAMLGLGAIALVAAFADSRLRQPMFVATTAAWVPMGVYFIASNNPSSWAISGSFIYVSAMTAATYTQGWRKWAELGLMTLGAVLAATSRADAGFYLFVITLAAWMLVPLSRKARDVFLWSMATTVFGLAMFLSAGQTGDLTSSGGWPVDENASVLRVLKEDLHALPEFFSALWGTAAGPGWFDVPLDGWSTYIMLFVAGGMLFIGAQQLWLRKGLSAVILVGALLGIPVASMVLRHVYPVTYFQARYVLPLLAVFFLVWISGKNGKSLMQSTGQMVFLVAMASIANAFALFRTIERFSAGHDLGFRALGSQWWPWSISAQTVLIIGSISMAVGLAALAWFCTQSSGAEESLEAGLVESDPAEPKGNKRVTVEIQPFT